MDTPAVSGSVGDVDPPAGSTVTPTESSPGSPSTIRTADA
jgi:hypothetical protein